MTTPTPVPTPLQQFKDLEKTFWETFTYVNTGPTDDSDIVLTFFLNAYMLRAQAEQNDDTVSRFMIDKSMRQNEFQFGKMLGGDDALKSIKEAAEILVDVRAKAAGQRALTNQAEIIYN